MLRIPLPADLRDPWTAAGAALLLAGTAAVGVLYRSAPQSVAEAGARIGAAARPSSYAAHRGRAEERLRVAEGHAAAGRDSLAAPAFAEAGGEAVRARDLAADDSARALAVDLWGRAMLGQAELTRRAATGRGLRPDDNDALRGARIRVEAVLRAPVAGATRARAEAMHAAIDRQLRTGPLEWLPD